MKSSLNPACNWPENWRFASRTGSEASLFSRCWLRRKSSANSGSTSGVMTRRPSTHSRPANTKCDAPGIRKQGDCSLTRTQKAKEVPANVWESILSSVEPSINPQSYQTWLKPTRLLPSSNGKLRIEVPNPEFIEYILEH